MKITVEPTPEMFEVEINGAMIPLRVWTGRTDSGIPLVAYVLSIVPEDRADAQHLKLEIPSYMRPSRETFNIKPETAR